MLTEEQHKIRLGGIGGSEIAAVCGLNPWMRPIDVYLNKIGLAEFDETVDTERGTFLERGIIDWYAHRFKRAISFVGTLVHPRHPVVRATPDAVADETYVVEVKSPSWRTCIHWGDEGGDSVPDYYLPQVQWELACTGLKKGDIVALIDGNIRRYTVSFNDRLFGALLEQAERFWRNYVERKEPPPIDGSESYSEYLAQMFPRSNEDVVEQDDEQTADLILNYKKATAEFEQAELRKRAARQHLENKIGNHAGLRGPWGMISYRHNKDSQIVDHKALCASLDQSLVKTFTKVRKGARVFRPTFKE